MLIPFQGHITERDLIRMFSLALKSKRWLFFVFAPPFLVFSGLAIMNMAHATSYLYVMMTVFFGIMAVYPFWGPRTSASNTYRRQADMRGTIEGYISNDEIMLRTTNSSQNIKWAVWKKVIRNREFVLLFQGSGCFNFFPRSFFASDEDWQKFQAILDEKVKSGVLKK